MLDRWAHFLYRKPWVVLCSVLIIVIVAGVYGASVFSHLSTGNDFEDPATQSTQAQNIATSQFARTQKQLLILFTSTSQSVNAPLFHSTAARDLADVQSQPHVIKVLSYYSSGSSSLVSNNHMATFAEVSMDGTDAEQQQVYTNLNNDFKNTSGPVQVLLGGSTAANVQINQQVTSDLKRAETISFPVIAILLILIFGNLVAATVPLYLGGLSILGALFMTKLLSEFTPMSAYVINVITLLGLGLAIDYSLFMVGRFREELASHDSVETAILATVKRAGRTIMFSGTTVIISLLSLTVFPEVFLRSMGLSGAAVVASAVLLSLSIVPASLILLGRRINYLSLPGRNVVKKQRVASSGFWYRFSNFVMHRPVITLLTTLIVLLAIGSQFLHVQLSSPDIYSAPTSFSSRQVNDLLSSNFKNTSTEPISIVVHTSGSATSLANITYLANYVSRLQHLSGVTRVDSLLTHLPTNVSTTNPAAHNTLIHSAAFASVLRQYASGNYQQLSIYQSFSPQSNQAQALIKNIRSIPVPAGYTPLVGGVSAELVDLLHSLRVHLPWALAIIFCTTIILIFLLMGGILVPIKAVVLGMISLSAAFGILVWVFQFGHFAGTFSLAALGSLDATSTILIFAIAFGLSMDYEFFLLSRIKEEYEKTGDNRHSVAYGVQKTAGIITSAALLLISVIGLFTISKISLIQQIGMGLAVAVAIDSTLVRMVMVPATMRLLGEANWWAPKPLRAIYARFGLHD